MLYIGEVFYTRRTAWITMGIILAVIVPLLMCIVCGVYCYRKKALKEDPNWKMPLPSRSGSRATLRNLNSDGSDMDGTDTLKKSRSYDKVYRTHEPLEGKPNIEFPDKKWDLDDEDVTSSEGSELKDTKRAKDIQYISNTGDRPRQLGRRNMHPGGDDDINTQSFPPPPIESPDPISPSYSPTYSGLDRNSSFMNDQQPPPQSSATRQAPRPPSNAVRVLPGPGPSSPSPPDQFLTFSGPSSPQPPPQDVGLPRVNAKATEV
uniref:Uncharacterized protein n=1 Tax=Lutzomyia longipalpis TaxID=7200 RepID=A0A7G3B5Y1_LUTLO